MRWPAGLGSGGSPCTSTSRGHWVTGFPFNNYFLLLDLFVDVSVLLGERTIVASFFQPALIY